MPVISGAWKVTTTGVTQNAGKPIDDRMGPDTRSGARLDRQAAHVDGTADVLEAGRGTLRWEPGEGSDVPLLSSTATPSKEYAKGELYVCTTHKHRSAGGTCGWSQADRPDEEVDTVGPPTATSWGVVSNVDPLTRRVGLARDTERYLRQYCGADQYQNEQQTPGGFDEWDRILVAKAAYNPITGGDAMYPHNSGPPCDWRKVTELPTPRRTLVELNGGVYTVPAHPNGLFMWGKQGYIRPITAPPSGTIGQVWYDPANYTASGSINTALSTYSALDSDTALVGTRDTNDHDCLMGLSGNRIAVPVDSNGNLDMDKVSGVAGSLLKFLHDKYQPLIDDDNTVPYTRISVDSTASPVQNLDDYLTAMFQNRPQITSSNPLDGSFVTYSGTVGVDHVTVIDKIDSVETRLGATSAGISVPFNLITDGDGTNSTAGTTLSTALSSAGKSTSEINSLINSWASGAVTNGVVSTLNNHIAALFNCQLGVRAVSESVLPADVAATATQTGFHFPHDLSTPPIPTGKVQLNLNDACFQQYGFNAGMVLTLVDSSGTMTMRWRAPPAATGLGTVNYVEESGGTTVKRLGSVVDSGSGYSARHSEATFAGLFELHARNIGVATQPCGSVHASYVFIRDPTTFNQTAYIDASGSAQFTTLSVDNFTPGTLRTTQLYAEGAGTKLERLGDGLRLMPFMSTHVQQRRNGDAAGTASLLPHSHASMINGTHTGSYGAAWNNANVRTVTSTLIKDKCYSTTTLAQEGEGVYMHMAEMQRLTLCDCRHRSPAGILRTELYEDVLLTATLGHKWNLSNNLDSNFTERALIFTGPSSSSVTDYQTYDANYPTSSDKFIYMRCNQFLSISDDRHKYHEQPISDGLSVVRRLAPKTYCMSGVELTPEREAELERGPRTGTMAGLIAQEVQDVVPSAAHGGDTMSVDYQQLFVYAMAAVKELDATVTELKAARSSQALVIQSLLSRVAALE